MSASSRKEPEMAYKKPKIVAVSAVKKSFVAGCSCSQFKNRVNFNAK